MSYSPVEVSILIKYKPYLIFIRPSIYCLTDGAFSLLCIVLNDVTFLGKGMDVYTTPFPVNAYECL
ncbi:hypothetical protein SAMN05216559_1818 [Halomicrobium zhouii]|uniref:Uncharacterized protein n=1 Tax=Halomicrobium zhouii TaxID=767519 RepID=A0A1I6L1D1_9EURY|nr:hypothetical protein SAMN05216559_1818 [Halomicrobium zhouii]